MLSSAPLALLRRVRTLLPALLLLGPLARAQAPGPLVEPSTHSRFEPYVDQGGTRFRCLGVGVRKIVIVKVYAAAYCMAEDSARALSQRYRGSSSKNLQDDASFFSAAAEAPGDKLVIMQLVRDVSRKQLADAFEKDLRQILPPAQVAKLVAAIPADLHKGQTARISSHGRVLTIEMGGQVRTIDDLLITARLWQIWLGPHSITPSLKNSLAQQVGAGGS